MTNGTICCIRRTESIRHAAAFLSEAGYTVSTYPTRNTRHLLLPVPSFSRGDSYIQEILPQLSGDVILYGGGLNIQALRGYRTVDLLRDEAYLHRNAAITAECALSLLSRYTEIPDSSVLILGWGRIGSRLGILLRNSGAKVTGAARSSSAVQRIRAEGHNGTTLEELGTDLRRFEAIVNTVPAMILPECRTDPDTPVLELASTPGLVCDRIIDGRGLPDRFAPEASGRLIARTMIRLIKEEGK